ncbi:hypothetical protein KY328_04710, partial [Candidatus Woesearchaeota archaeon]|nr:hypothetical protein [Candidatus Woesearchaeota archaeon]
MNISAKLFFRFCSYVPEIIKELSKRICNRKIKNNIKESIRRILKEETNSKRQGMLNILEDVGLYDFTKMTGLKY